MLEIELKLYLTCNIPSMQTEREAFVLLLTLPLLFARYADLLFESTA